MDDSGHPHDSSRTTPAPSEGRPRLRFTLSHRHRPPGALVLSVAGDLDLSATPPFSEALADAITRQPPLLVVDLTPTRFLSCAGLSVLVSARHLVGTGTRMVVVAPARATRRPLALTEADRFLTVCRDLDEALAEAVPGQDPLATRTVVAGPAILVVATGGSPSSDTGPLTRELCEAAELRRGVVLLDASACTLRAADLAQAVHTAVRRGRCGVRVLTADPELISLLDATGIAHTAAAEPGE